MTNSDQNIETDTAASVSLTSCSPPVVAGHAHDVVVQCAWGRLLFGHTFLTPEDLVQCLRQEVSGQRDIALYVRDPQVAVSLAPQDLFLDPSHTYRLWLSRLVSNVAGGEAVRIRRVRDADDVAAVNRIYAAYQMAPMNPELCIAQRDSRIVTYLVAECVATGELVGSVTGVDHQAAFGDPERGSSLWALAVDPTSAVPGVGERLVQSIVEHHRRRGCAFLDLSVMHDNRPAMQLYEKLGFERVPVFGVKHKNPVNEPLFIAPAPDGDRNLNPYARIIVDEARRRGIRVDIEDARRGVITLTHGARRIRSQESLCSLTSSVAALMCSDKQLTSRVARKAGVRVPEQRDVEGGEQDRVFLAEWGRIVVKPIDGEQGRGVSVDVRSRPELEVAIRQARQVSSRIMLEQFVAGDDVRVLVIGEEVVAAAVRRPPAVVGTGEHDIRTLVRRLSRRRSAATAGESSIPEDVETERTIQAAGYRWDSVLPQRERLVVRRTANLHTGGTIHDVTDHISDELRADALRVAAALEIPVVGLDFIVPDLARPDHVFIEANERPGLANHEPRPTAQRFVDLLFPETARRERNP